MLIGHLILINVVMLLPDGSSADNPSITYTFANGTVMFLTLADLGASSPSQARLSPQPCLDACFDLR